jgi:hypothetical protein
VPLPRLMARLPASFALIGAALLLASCTPRGAGSDGQRLSKITCPDGVAAAGAPAGAPSGEPDFASYGFARVAATERFTPGQEQRVSAGPIVVTVPADFYTDPVQFELLLGDEQSWQRCVPENLVVIAPYAYRVTDPANGSRIGRFDKPVSTTVSDARIVPGTVYWTTAAANPPTAEPAGTQPQPDGTTIRVTNGSARIGWITTAPKR